MSAYVEGKTSIKEVECLVEALIEMGFKKEHIEVYEEATNLYGYHGDKRDQLANVIVRRKYVGTASNDLGFVRGADGTYAVIVSEYDSNNNSGKWTGQLDKRFSCQGGGFAVEIGARAAAIQAEKAAQKKGLKTKRTVDNITKKITISCYR